MNEREPHPGAIPPEQRRLTLIVAGVVIGVIVIGCLLVNLLAGSPVDWFWLISGTVMVSALIVFFLWVRLSE